MSPAAPEDFAEALRAAMNKRPEMSNGAVARAAGIDESHLYKLMGGKVEHPQPRTIKRLAAALDAPELLPFTNNSGRQGLRKQVEEAEDLARQALRAVAELQAEFERLRQDGPPPPPEGG